MALSVFNYEWVTAGAEIFQWSYVNTSGTIIGTRLLDPATDLDTSSNIGRVRGFITAPLAINDPQLDDAIGRDGGVEYLLGDSQRSPTFVVECASFNVRFLEASYGLPDISFIGKGRRRMPMIERGAPRRPLFLMFSRRSMRLDDEDYSVPSFEHALFYYCDVVFLGSGHAFQQAGSYRFLVVAHQRSQMPEGFDVVDMFTDAPGGKLSHDIINTSYPLSFVATTGGVTSNTVVTPAYVPVSSSRIYAHKDGVSQTISSVDQSVPSITLAASMASGTLTVTSYEATEID